MNNRPFSVVVPVYNEEKILIKNSEKLISYLDQLDTPYEIFIGSNGSTDNTDKLGIQLSKKYPQIKFFTFKNKGVGRVFKKAVKDANYETIITLDVDLPTSFDFIPNSLNLIKSCDIVLGSKKKKQERAAYRKIFSAGFAFLVKLLLNLNFSDYAPNTKTYRKSAISEHLHKIDNGTIYVLQLLHFANKKNKKIEEIPVTCVDTRKSKFNLFKEIKHKFVNLLSIWWRHG